MAGSMDREGAAPDPRGRTRKVRLEREEETREVQRREGKVYSSVSFECRMKKENG